MQQFATTLFDAVPDKVKQMILARQPLARAPIIAESVDGIVLVQDLKRHHVLLKVCATYFPDSIPSGYFYADAFLQLDRKFQGKLLMSLDFLSQRQKTCSLE